MRILIVANSTGCIYELLDITDDKIKLINLSNGKEGWVEKEDMHKLTVSIKLTHMQEQNNLLIDLIKTLNLKYDRN